METELILQVVAVIFMGLSTFFGVEMKLAKGYSKRAKGHLVQIVDFFQALNDGWEDDTVSEDEWKKTYDKANIIVEEVKHYLPSPNKDNGDKK